MLPDASEPGSPSWWLLRLGKRLAGDQPRFDQLEAYWRGCPPLPHGNRKMREAYRRLQRLARTNFGALIAETLLERMRVVGFRAGADATDAMDKTAWGWWQANDLDADSGLVHRAAVVMSRAYVIVGPDPDHPDKPLVTAEDPRQVIHESSPTNRRDVRAALKTWWDDVADAQLATLYLPDRIHYFRTTNVKRDSGTSPWVVGSWELDTSDDYPEGSAENPLGEVPVTPFVNRPDMAGEGLGEYEDVLDMLDRINTVILDRLVVSAMQAYRQRYATGVDLVDEDGNPSADFDPGADLLWSVSDPNAKFGEFSPTDLSPIVKAIESDVQYLGAITRTPPHYLLAGIVNAPLALDTVVPVPGGRKAMGELNVGDKVFDPDGNVQDVVGMSPIYQGRPCYRLTFDDGTTVVADGEHQWATTHFADPARPYRYLGIDQDGPRRYRFGAVRETSVVTTEQIAGSLLTGMGTRNHHIDVAAPPDGPERKYGIPPYLLGVWLGDGDRIHGYITSHRDDAEEMAQNIRGCGEIVDVAPYSAKDFEHRDCRFIKIRHDRKRCPYGHLRAGRLDTIPTHCRECDRIRQSDKFHGRPTFMGEKTNLSFTARLKAVGAWKNKHIPEEYFHGSFKQRLALLQGLMDTDGTVKRGQGGMELGFHDERLASDACRLIQSLGQKVQARKSRFSSKSKGVSGDRWRMVWSSRDPVFRLARKAALQNQVFEGDHKQKPFRRYIVSCEPVESVPVRCITVSGDSHLFCITDAFVATHNSGDALATAETGLASKASERLTEFGNSWERVYRQAGKLLGGKVGVDAEVLWRDPQFHSLSQMAAANVQLMQAGVPWRTRMRMLDMSPSEIDRMEAERAHDAMLTAALAPLSIAEGGQLGSRGVTYTDKGLPEDPGSQQGQTQPPKVPVTTSPRGPRNGQTPAP